MGLWGQGAGDAYRSIQMPKATLVWCQSCSVPPPNVAHDTQSHNLQRLDQNLPPFRPSVPFDAVFSGYSATSHDATMRAEAPVFVPAAHVVPVLGPTRAPDLPVDGFPKGSSVAWEDSQQGCSVPPGDSHHTRGSTGLPD